MLKSNICIGPPLLTLITCLSLASCKEASNDIEGVRTNNSESYEMIFEFGEQNKLGMVAHTFTLKNEQDHPVRILDVRKDCGCISGSIEGQSIPANGQILFPVEIDLGNSFSGPLNRNVWVDVDRGRSYHLKMTGFVIEQVPRSLHFGSFRQGDSSAMLDFRLRSIGMHTIDLLDVTFDPKLLNVDYSPDEEQVGVYRFSVTPHEKAPKGSFTTEVKLTTDDPVNPVKIIFLDGYVERDVEFSLDRVVVSKHGSRLTVRTPYQDGPVEIAGFEWNGPELASITTGPETTGGKRELNLTALDLADDESRSSELGIVVIIDGEPITRTAKVFLP